MDSVKSFLSRKGVKLFLISIGGEIAPSLVENLLEPIDDEILAKKVGLSRGADIRTHLNKIHYASVIDYNRSKDKDSGWYYYAWFLRPDKLYDEYLRKMKQDYDDIMIRLSNLEAYTLYYCKNCNISYDYDKAFENLYHCNVCNKIMERNDTEEDSIKLEKIAKGLLKEIKEVEDKFGFMKDMKPESLKVM